MEHKPLSPLFNLDAFQREPKVRSGFYQQDILSVSQFSKNDLEYIVTRADEMAEMVNRWGTCDLLKGYNLACVFYEPSTRTSSSFIAAMERLGGKVIPITTYRWEDGDSMADNNSSGFNFRVIEGTNKLSLHSFGRAVDINPVQNPVIYPNGPIAPAGAVYRPQSKGTFTAGDPNVQEFIRRGWHWGGNFEQPKDYHHFEKT